QATMFGTTQEFLERMGLPSLDDLPPIAELFPSADVMEALERTLQATAETDAASAPAADKAPAAPAEEPVQPAMPLSDADLPEPEPPAWAVDPPVAEG
ncbi:MAG: segregation and condensation protein B, partial [Acidimicrobiales bacterium]|nr:segregation and condensation protein B [Acidimicrobiales bacterium]